MYFHKPARLKQYHMHCSPLLVILHKDTLISVISPDLGLNYLYSLYFKFSLTSRCVYGVISIFN